MEARLEKIIHELKQIVEVQKHLRFNIDRLDEIEKRYSKRLGEMKDKMDGYITNLFQISKVVSSTGYWRRGQ